MNYVNVERRVDDKLQVIHVLKLVIGHNCTYHAHYLGIMDGVPIVSCLCE